MNFVVVTPGATRELQFRKIHPSKVGTLVGGPDRDFCCCNSENVHMARDIPRNLALWQALQIVIFLAEFMKNAISLDTFLKS